jgi:hypothetical protein
LRKSSFTPRQGEYLAFISQYRELVDRSPSEGDIADFFGVSGASAHQMVATLEAKSLLRRIPGIARSMRPMVRREALPVLGGPGHLGSDPVSGLTTFAVYVARRLVSRNAFAAVMTVALVAERLADLLASFELPQAVVEKAQAAVLRAAEVRPRPVKRQAPPAIGAEQPPGRGPERPPAPRRPRLPKSVPPGQGSLF